MATIEITILNGVSAGDVFRFDLADATGENGAGGGNGAPSSITIGRSPDCELVLQESTVSRRHASVERKGGVFVLTDLGSSHGTQHMGFPLRPGEEGARKLSTGDEFKISEMLFRVSIPEEVKAAEKKKPAHSSTEEGSSAVLPRHRKSKLLRLGAPILLIVLLLLYLLAPEEKGGLPAQHSKDVILAPSYSVAGYYPGSGSDRKDQKDSSHIDMAQYDLPSSDVVVEYEIYCEAPVEIRVDQAKVETVNPTVDHWQYREMLVRDLALGTPRRLVFDNTDYPRKAGEKPSPLKKWGVRNVRATPVQPLNGVQAGFANYLTAALGLAESVDKSADGLFLFVRSLQSACIQLMQEQRIDAIDYSLALDATSIDPFPELPVIQQRLKEIQMQSQGASSPEAAREVLRQATKNIGQYDAEIWRRVQNRINKAKTSVKVGNSIEAHDLLVGVMNMFPPEGDYRWFLANRMYMDNKVVPKNVREHPEKFRPN